MLWSGLVVALHLVFCSGALDIHAVHGASVTLAIPQRERFVAAVG